MRPDKNCKSAWLLQEDGGGDGRMCRAKPNALKVINAERVSPSPVDYRVQEGGVAHDGASFEFLSPNSSAKKKKYKSQMKNKMAVIVWANLIKFCLCTSCVDLKRRQRSIIRTFPQGGTFIPTEADWAGYLRL